VRKFPEPKNLLQLKSFLGLANYYHKLFVASPSSPDHCMPSLGRILHSSGPRSVLLPLSP
jgi:hypothetical protein